MDEKEKNRFFEFFEETSGMLSANRGMFIYCSFAVVSAWLIISLVKMVMQEIPWSVIVIIGTFMTGKVIQKFAENGK